MTISPKILLLLITLPYISFVYADYEGACNHDHLNHNIQDLDVEEDFNFDEQGRLLKSTSDYPNLRIYANYDLLTKTAPTSYASYIKNDLVPPVIGYLQSALKVKYPVVGNLKLGTSVKTICDSKTPSILQTGVPADYVILFEAISESGSLVASSSTCYQASGTKRPLIAKTQINRPGLLEAKGDVLQHEKNMYVLIHELMHTLGFSASNYQNFIDENGKPRKGHIKSMSIAGKTRTVVDVPPLTQKLRDFYGCPTIPGGIMENDGGSGVATSHFERKYFVYETMANGGIYSRRVSEFSLALLEGSGWYVPDYSYAEPFFYGQGKGCNFVNDQCSATKVLFSEFCTGSSRSCAPQGRSGGKCSTDSKTDGCKYVDPDVDYDCENDDGADNARLPSLEVYGRAAGSKCFSGDLNTRKSSNGATSFCFKYNCVGEGSNTELEVAVGKTTVTCKKEGKMSVNGYYGGINCPDPLTFCSTVGKKYCPRGCMGRGECVNFKCVCKAGYSGIDCGLNA